MSLHIRSSITGGIGRVLTRAGLLLAAVYVLVGAVWQVLFYSAVESFIQQPGSMENISTFPTVEIPFMMSAGGAIVSLLLLQYLTVVTIRTFVNGSRTIPTEYYTRNIVPVFVNTVIGSLVFGLIVLIGSVLFVIPGLIAYVAFIFTLLYVAVEDQNFIAAFRSSWRTTRGHWLRLFLLLVIVFVFVSVIPGILSAITRLAVSAAAGPGAGTLVSGTLTLPFSLFVLGILAEAFSQLRNIDPTY